MKPSEHALEKQMLMRLNDLQLERDRTESSCMFGGQDESDIVCAELREHSERTKEEAQVILKSDQKSFIRRLKKRIPGRTDENVNRKEIFLGRTERIQDQYRLSQSIRSSFDLISTVAYMTEPPVTTDAYRQLQLTEWKMSYNSDIVDPEWKDMQALCSAMILLFEHLLSPDLSENAVLGRDVEKILDQSKLLGYNFYNLLSYPEYFASTSELLGCTAAMVHVAIKCVETIRNSFDKQHGESCDGGKSLGYYGRQVRSLCVIVDDILDKSNIILHEASKPERNAVVLRNVPKFVRPTSPKLMKKGASDEVAEAGKHLESCKYFGAEDIKSLGIPEYLLSRGEGRQIGFGSSSVVFERHVLEGTRRYAVKEPSGVTTASRDSLWNKLGREAQVWRLLKHDNVLPLRGFCLLSNDLPGLVMDVCRWNLKDFVRECSPSPRQRLELLHGASEGLAYLHSQNIAHGDLRACNILVKENALRTGFSALLADFGTAYFVNGATDPVVKETKFKTSHDQVGNAGWLSPELLRKVASQNEEDTYPYISIPGDIYSFGCIFLEVIFEHDPYQGCSSDEEKKEKILQGLLPASLEETSSIHYEFLRLLWDSTPERRPTAEQTADRILIFLQNDNL
ncbi:hypothetical protein ACEPAI_4414 [Sanghuangporus weigelae]